MTAFPSSSCVYKSGTRYSKEERSPQPSYHTIALGCLRLNLLLLSPNICVTVCMTESRDGDSDSMIRNVGKGLHILIVRMSMTLPVWLMTMKRRIATKRTQILWYSSKGAIERQFTEIYQVNVDQDCLKITRWCAQSPTWLRVRCSTSTPAMTYCLEPASGSWVPTTRPQHIDVDSIH